MDLLRRPTVLAALAAAVLAINVVVLVALGDDDGAADTGAPSEQATGGAEGDDGSAAGDQDAGAGDGAEVADGTDGTDGEAGEGAEGEDDGAGGEEAATDGDGAGEEQAAEPAALTPPAAGTYTYAASGTWGLEGGGGSEQFELPDTATATVVDEEGGAWELRLAAGDRYADRFGFQVVDGGLEWVRWVLERDGERLSGETAYACSGDGPFHVPGATDRVATHTCQGPQEIVSEGTVEAVGREEVTLGDGSVVGADRLLYTYTVQGPSVEGEGRLDLWLDPATGLRLREVRTIDTRNLDAQGATTSTYREAVEFTLRSTTPEG